jgi:SEC-C motif-containing protein
VNDTIVPVVDRCPCLRGLPYAQCCGPYLRGSAFAPTAERLMRSRYTAFSLQDRKYLLASWHPSTRPAVLELDPSVRWIRLDILGSSGGGLLDNRGTVEFRAHFRLAATHRSQHENSVFLRQDKRWYYFGPA